MKKFDLEDRLVDFAVMVIEIFEPFSRRRRTVASPKPDAPPTHNIHTTFYFHETPLASLSFSLSSLMPHVPEE